MGGPSCLAADCCDLRGLLLLFPVCCCCCFSGERPARISALDGEEDEWDEELGRGWVVVRLCCVWDNGGSEVSWTVVVPIEMPVLLESEAEKVVAEAALARISGRIGANGISRAGEYSSPTVVPCPCVLLV